MKSLLVLGLILISVLTSAFACEDASISAIDTIAMGLVNYTSSPTVSNSKAIVSIGKSCKSEKVKVKAAEALGLAIGPDQPSAHNIAFMMRDLCRQNAKCAIVAIRSLSNGIVNYTTHPTMTLSSVIADIVEMAPFDDVKAEAVTALSKCMSGQFRTPTQYCAADLERIGNCSGPK
jgi:hypothetical protein